LFKLIKANAVRVPGNLSRIVKFIDGNPIDSFSYSCSMGPLEIRVEARDKERSETFYKFTLVGEKI
jgi:hypothetical protein